MAGTASGLAENTNALAEWTTASAERLILFRFIIFKTGAPLWCTRQNGLGLRVCQRGSVGSYNIPAFGVQKVGKAHPQTDSPLHDQDGC